MEVLPDSVMWAALVGLGTPILVAIVNQPRMPGWARGLITVVACVVVGGVTAELAGALTGRTWVTAALVVATAAIGSYNLFWKPTGIAPAIESATSPKDRTGVQAHRP